MKSYDYANRSGVRPISWEEFGLLARQLAAALAAYQPECIVGIARAGLFPATAVACALRMEMFPTRITRRLNDQVIYPEPVWKAPVSAEVAGKAVAVIDEMADTGQTLALVAEAVRSLGARQVVTASLVRHTWASPAPDQCALVTNELVIFPWDAQVWIDGRWQMHPEIRAALKLQETSNRQDE